MDSLLTDFVKSTVTPQIQDILNETESIEPIARYFMLDAILSSKYTITLDEILIFWQKEETEIKKIHDNLKNLSISKLEKSELFAFYVLQHLVFRKNKEICDYNIYARNFIVSLLRTNKCLCAS